MGGVGKSTIVRGIAQNRDVRRRYPDGIHVITLGFAASKATLLQGLCNVMNDGGAKKKVQELRTRNALEEILREAIRWFAGKRCAFLIDDAWVHDIGITWFLRICELAGRDGKSSIIIATRLEHIAALAKNERIVLVVPRSAQGFESRRILFLHAEVVDGEEDNDVIERSIKGILDICAGLPVSLSAVGKGVKRLRISTGEKKVWERYLSRLVAYRERLFTEDFDEYGNLMVTLSASVALLDDERDALLGYETKLTFAEMHRRLCVFQKQACVPAATLKHLWETKSEIDAEVIGSKFAEVGLAENVIEKIGSKRVWHLSMHDSMHNFAVTEARRYGEVVSSHDVLLKGYSSSERVVSARAGTLAKWWAEELEPDAYMHRNLCRHLLAADRGTELIELLKTPQWTVRQLEVNGALVLSGDFSIGIEAIRAGMIDDMPRAHLDVEETLRLISEAVTLSSSFIVRNPREIWFQIYGRLIEHAKEIKGIQEYLSRVAKETRRNWLRCLNGILEEAGGVNTMKFHMDHPVMRMAKIGDAERFAFVYGYDRVRVVNLRCGEIENEWKIPRGFTWDIAIGASGTRVVLASTDITVPVWDAKMRRRVTTFEGHTDGVTCVTVMEDGRRVVTGSYDGTAQVWDIDTGRVVSEPFRGHKEEVLCVSVLGDGEHVVTGGGYNMLQLWSTKTGVQGGEAFVGHEFSVLNVAVTPDGKRIVSGSRDHTLRIWDVPSRKQIGRSLKALTEFVNCIAISRDGQRIASHIGNNTIRVIDIETRGDICNPLEGHTDQVTGVSFVDGSDSIISCSHDGTVRVWDVRRKSTERKLDWHYQAVISVSFTLDGKLAVSGSKDKTVRVWDVRSGQQIGGPLKGHSDAVTGVDVTLDGKRIVSVSLDKTIRVWDPQSCEVLHILTGHTAGIHSVAMAANGELIVTGSEDKTIRVWNLGTKDGNQIVLRSPRGYAERVFFSDDGKRIISVNSESEVFGSQPEVFVWELETRAILKRRTSILADVLSRSQVADLIREPTFHDDAGLSIPLWQPEISYGEGEDTEVLGTMEAVINAWALSPDKETICVGLWNGKVGFMKLERQER